MIEIILGCIVVLALLLLVIVIYHNKFRISIVKIEEAENNIDLHFHFLDASTKKDGPSAGLSIAVALMSVLEKKIISEDIAFTGELSLNGNVLKIGGLKEKLIGAYNEGVKKVYIPHGNLIDLEDIPKYIKDNLEIIAIEHFEDLYTNFFK